MTAEQQEAESSPKRDYKIIAAEREAKEFAQRQRRILNGKRAEQNKSHLSARDFYSWVLSHCDVLIDTCADKIP